jgi:hypothetical protein
MAMGGIGEAAMLGAVMGGGSALLTGGDPLKGALMGTLTGGAGAGLSSALSSTLAPSVIPAVTETAVTQAVAPAVAENLAASAATTPGITTLANGLPTDISNQILGQIAPSAATPAAVMPAAAPAQNLIARVPNFESNLIARVPGDIPIQPTSFDSFGSPVPITSPAFSSADPTGLAQQQLNLNSAASAPATPKTFAEGMKKFMDSPLESIKANPFTAAGSALTGATAARKKKEEEEEYSGPLSRFKYNPDSYRPSSYADGGIASLYSGGYDQMVGEEPMYMSNMAHGGIANLGSYSDGGRMLKGPGDGMSDSIPASISGKRPARLADGEFVVPADVVSHLGNGSTDAGAKQLYAMMNKVRQARTGRKAQGREINPRQYVPA